MKHATMLALTVIVGAELSILVGGEWVVMAASFAWIVLAAIHPNALRGVGEVSHLRVIPAVTWWLIWPRASESR